MDRPSPGTNEGGEKRLGATHPIINRSLPRSAEDAAALTLDGAKELAPDSGAMTIKKHKSNTTEMTLSLSRRDTQ